MNLCVVRFKKALEELSVQGRESVDVDESDPDTLQLLDELDADWVKRWREAKKMNGEKNVPQDLAAFVVLPEKVEPMKRKLPVKR